MTTEIGRPLVESRDEVEWSAACFDYYAEVARSEIGRVIPPIEASQFAVVVKEPHGVVGCIVPWNFPLLLLTWKLAPALAAGNTTVCKPSEVTPLSTLALAEIFEDLPDGTVNLVAGAGEIGAGISAHPGIDCVAFTGSVATGQKVGVACASRNARANLEMGGKDPFIVCSDIGDEGVQIAAKGGAWAAYLNAGQVCTSSERFYVMEDVYDEYVAAFVEFTNSLVIGDPLDAQTDIGPMVSAVQRGKAVAQVEAAVASGAELLTGGGNAGQAKGHYLEPCVLTGVPGGQRSDDRGDLRPGCPDRAGEDPRRSDRQGQRSRLRPRREHLHAGPEHRDHLPEAGAGRIGLDQRSADRQRRRPVRRFQEFRHRP